MFHERWCHLLKKCNWPLILAETARRNHKNLACRKYEPFSLHNLLSTGHHVLGVSFITSLSSKLCTALTTQNTENKCIILHAQHTTAHQPDVFLSEIQSVSRNKHGMVVFPHRKTLPMSNAKPAVIISNCNATTWELVRRAWCWKLFYIKIKIIKISNKIMKIRLSRTYRIICKY